MRARGWCDPVKVILINPNSTVAMTDSAVGAARAAAPEIAFEGWTSAEGPPAIEGPEDGAAAIPPLLTLVKRASDAGADVIIIACFDDTGLSEAQALADCPVVGIGQASFVMAGLLSGATAVITTVEAAVPVIEANVIRHGFGHIVGDVAAAQVPVLMLEADPARAAKAFLAATAHLPNDTENVILGCAGAVTIMDEMRAQLPFRVIDSVTAAARLCKALVA